MIREFQASDAQAASHLICRNLREVNCWDYPLEVIEQLIQEYTPERLLRMTAEGYTFTFEKGGIPTGILRILPAQGAPQVYWLRTLFVSPDYHGQGIGRQLVEAGEQFARQKGRRCGASLCIPDGPSFLSEARVHRSFPYPDSNGLYLMKKDLSYLRPIFTMGICARLYSQ